MKYIIGVDLGGTNLRIGLFNHNIQLIERRIFSTRKFKNKNRLIAGIINSIETIVKDNCIKKSSLLGVGLGVPGPLDYKKKIVYFFPNIKGWFNVCLGKILKDRLKTNIFIDNDANLICLAEAEARKPKKFKNLVCITLGTGVGGGLIIEGKLYRGSNYVAGEIGHIPVNEKGPKCSCGAKGCLESYVGSLRIKKLAKKIFKRDINLEELSHLARLNNKKAVDIWKMIGEKLGIVLAGVVNLLNPEAIIIAGGVSNAGKVLFESIRKTIKERAMPIQARAVKILKSSLKDNAGIMGAAILVKREAGLC